MFRKAAREFSRLSNVRALSFLLQTRGVATYRQLRQVPRIKIDKIICGRVATFARARV